MIASRTPGARPGLRGLARWMGLATLVLSGSAFASEAELQLPDLGKVTFLGGTNGRSLLMWGLLVCLFGFGFGVYQFAQLRKLPVHKAMLEISELIYETCKTYLITQGKFILVLEVLIGAVMVLYFGVLQHMEVVQGRHHPVLQPDRHRRQLRRGLVRHPGEHLRQQPHGVRRPARQALPDLRHPAPAPA